MYYCRQVALFVLLLSGLSLAAIWLQRGAIVSHEGNWLRIVYKEKFQARQTIREPALVILSGSSGMFGISCAQILRQQDNFKCLNGSTHVGLQLDYILWKGRQMLRAGDIVLLQPEYELYYFTGEPNELSLDHLLSNDWDYFVQLPLWKQIYYLSKISLKRIGKGLFWKFFDSFNSLKRERYEMYYSVNEYGDILDNPREARFQKKLAEEVAPNMGKPMTEEARRVLREFIQWCQEHQVKVLALWPPIIKFPEFQGEDAQRFFAEVQSFYEGEGVQVLNRPEEHMYPHQFFYDTPYHLNTEGTKRNTDQIIEPLQSAGVLDERSTAHP